MSAGQFDEELFWLMTVYIGQRMWPVLAKGRPRNSARPARDNQAFTRKAGWRRDSGYSLLEGSVASKAGLGMSVNDLARTSGGSGSIRQDADRVSWFQFERAGWGGRK